MKELSLNEKVDLIKNSKGKSQRALATQYGLGKTQEQRICRGKQIYSELSRKTSMVTEKE